jgi:hypothetical protein
MFKNNSDTSYPHHRVDKLKYTPSILKNIPEDGELVFINSSNGYLDKRTTRLTSEVSRLERKVHLLSLFVVKLAKKLDMSEEEIKEYL